MLVHQAAARETGQKENSALRVIMHAGGTCFERMKNLHSGRLSEFGWMSFEYPDITFKLHLTLKLALLSATDWTGSLSRFMSKLIIVSVSLCSASLYSLQKIQNWHVALGIKVSLQIFSFYWGEKSIIL